MSDSLYAFHNLLDPFVTLQSIIAFDTYCGKPSRNYYAPLYMLSQHYPCHLRAFFHNNFVRILLFLNERDVTHKCMRVGKVSYPSK